MKDMDRFSLSRGVMPSKDAEARDALARSNALRLRKGKVVLPSPHQKIQHIPDLSYVLRLRRQRNKHLKKNPSIRQDLDQKKRLIRGTYSFQKSVDYINRAIRDTTDTEKSFYLHVILDELESEEGLAQYPLPTAEYLSTLPGIVLGADLCYIQEYYFSQPQVFFFWQLQSLVPFDATLERLMYKAKIQRGLFFEINADEIIQVLDEWPNPPPFWQALLQWDELSHASRQELERLCEDFVLQ